MLSMAEELGHESFFWDDDSWAFPILGGGGDDENGGKLLIENGKIVINIENPDDQIEKDEEKAPPPPTKGKKRSAPTNRRGGQQGNEVKVGGSSSGGGGGEYSDSYELHIRTERERRKKMRDMFANLHAFIPNLHPRADKSTIVDEAILYIRQLQLTLDNLEKLKKKLEGATTNLTTSDPSKITQPNLEVQSRDAFLAEQGSTSKQAVTLANPSISNPQLSATFKTWTSPNLILNVCGTDAHINVCCPKKPGLLTAIFLVMEKYKLEVVSAQVTSDRSTHLYTIYTRANGGPLQFPNAAILVEGMYKQAAAEIMLWLNA